MMFECIRKFFRRNDKHMMSKLPEGKNNTEHTSELSQVVTATAFKNAYAAFIGQADKNALSGKAEGG